MVPLGFIIFPYLIYLLSVISIKKNIFNYFSFGFLYGLGFLLVTLSWIFNPFLANEETKNFATLGFSLPIFLSLFFGLGFSIYKYIFKKFYLIIFTPFIFLSIEFVISKIFYGFPWITYSLVNSNNILGFYLLKFFGSFVTSYLVLLIFIFPVIFVFSKKLEFKKIYIYYIHLPFLIAIIALLILNLNKTEKIKKINLELFQIYSPINSINKKLIETEIINKIINSDSEYLIFAENNYPYLISDINTLSILRHIKDSQKVIIGASREENGRFYNSFLYLEKNNVQIFDKKILVPFGEFLPFRKYLKFMQIITGNVDYSLGNNPRLIVNNEINILPIICYEIIFNKILKNINKKNIDLLINITNDSWFGNKIGPYQHFYHSRMRALITNKYTIRVSNNGISAMIDNNGKIIQATKLNTRTSIKKTIKINNSIYFDFIHNFFNFYLIFIFFIYLILTYKLKHDK